MFRGPRHAEELLEEYLEEDKPMRDWLSAKHSDKARRQVTRR